MKSGNNSNKFGLLLAVALTASTSLACTCVPDLTGRSVPDGQRLLAERVPAGLEHAVEDPEADKPSAFRIIMLVPGKVTLQDPESQPIDITTLGTRVQEGMSTRTPDERVVYIAAAADIPTSEVAAVIDELRRQNVETVKLLTSSRDPEADEGGLFASPPPPPDRVFDLRIQFENLNEGRPNPWALAASFGGDRGPELNNEPHQNLEGLEYKLRAIYDEREFNRVFRENSSEIEKTIFLDFPDDEPERNYRDLVELVNTVKGAGASPIVLIERFRIPGGGGSHIEASPGPQKNQAVSDVISGGVVNGKATFLPKPDYPPAAKAVRASGAVNVEIIIDTDGNVIEANAVSGHPLLRRSGVTAARSARFAPTMLAGKPVKVRGVLVYNFTALE